MVFCYCWGIIHQTNMIMNPHSSEVNHSRQPARPRGRRLGQQRSGTTPSDPGRRATHRAYHATTGICQPGRFTPPHPNEERPSSAGRPHKKGRRHQGKKITWQIPCQRRFILQCSSFYLPLFYLLQNGGSAINHF